MIHLLQCWWTFKFRPIAKEAKGREYTTCLRAELHMTCDNFGEENWHNP